MLIQLTHVISTLCTQIMIGVCRQENTVVSAHTPQLQKTSQCIKITKGFWLVTLGDADIWRTCVQTGLASEAGRPQPVLLHAAMLPHPGCTMVSAAANHLAPLPLLPHCGGLARSAEWPR